MILILVFLCAAYLTGSIPTGFWLVRLTHGIDIRTIGSGSTGATNVKRAAGNKMAALVLGLDFIKGLLPVLLAHYLFPSNDWVPFLTAMMLVVGHSKSVFIGFAGGKSAATGLGCLFGLAPLQGLAIALLAFSVMKVSRYVSLGSLTAAVITAPLLVITQSPLPTVLFGVLSGLYVIYLHRSNIQRLLAGTENRLT